MMPSETSVSIEDAPCRAFFSAARWNGHAHHSATGAAQATSSHCQPGKRSRRHQRQHHRQIGQRNEEHQRHEQPPPQVGGVPGGRSSCVRRPPSVPPSLRLGLLAGGLPGRVPGLLDRGDQLRAGIPAGAVTRAVAVA